MKKTFQQRSPAALLFLALILTGSLTAQTKVDPGFNLFSVQQDVEIGKQSAQEVEQQMPLLRDRYSQEYVTQIGQRLARVAPGPEYPYQFKVLDVGDVNAFALPGGFMYLNRGLIAAAENESELAGVMAHEMAHVALRHGTNQASKAYLAQAGLGLLGGLFGGSGSTGQIVQAIGGFGLNAVFLKFSRGAEEQADIVGTQILAKAGYDPIAMATFFDLLQSKGGKSGKVDEFFSSHPSPGNRAARVREELRLLGRTGTKPPVGNFRELQRQVASLPASPAQQVAGGNAPPSDNRGNRGGVSIEAPSSRMRTFTQQEDLFRIRYPENWRVFEYRQGHGATIVPEGGAVNNNGQSNIIYGVLVDHFDPEEGPSAGKYFNDQGSRSPYSRFSLEEASNRLLDRIERENSYLRWQRNSSRDTSIDGDRALSGVLMGTSPVTRKQERVTLFTRLLPDGHLLYALFIAPDEDYPELSETFSRMISSLKVNEKSEDHR